MKPSGSPSDTSLILRFWLEQEDIWRASVQNPQTGDRVGFSDLEAVFDYIRQEAAMMGMNWVGSEEEGRKEGSDEA